MAVNQDPHQPTQTTDNQIDHQMSLTDQTVAFVAAVTPMMPGIHNKAKMGMMKKAQRTTLEALINLSHQRERGVWVEV